MKSIKEQYLELCIKYDKLEMQDFHGVVKDFESWLKDYDETVAELRRIEKELGLPQYRGPVFFYN